MALQFYVISFQLIILIL